MPCLARDLFKCSVLQYSGDVPFSVQFLSTRAITRSLVSTDYFHMMMWKSVLPLLRSKNPSGVKCIRCPYIDSLELSSFSRCIHHALWLFAISYNMHYNMINFCRKNKVNYSSMIIAMSRVHLFLLRTMLLFLSLLYHLCDKRRAANGVMRRHFVLYEHK